MFRGAGPTDVIAFALLIALVPPALLWLLTMPFRFVGPRARTWAHRSACGFLVLVIGLLVAKNLLSLHGLAALAVAIGGAAGFLALYARLRATRTWVALLAPASPAFVALFLLTSPTSTLLTEPAAAVGAQTGEGTTVVLVVLDELPVRSILDEAGGIDEQLFSNLARLAADGTFYRNTTTPAGATWYAVPSLLTGVDPRNDRAPTVAHHPENLFTALAPTHDVVASEVVTRLCPSSACTTPAGMDEGLGVLLADAARIYREMTSPRDGEGNPMAAYLEATVAVDDDDVDPFAAKAGDLERSQPARYRAFMEALDDLGDPGFAYLHLLLPHEPWRFLPSGVEYEQDADAVVGRDAFAWAPAAPPVDVIRQRHILQLVYADALVGGLLDRLEELGIYDDAVVVVTADHGIAFQPGESSRGTQVDAELEPVVDELAWVPLIVKAPGVAAGEVDDRDVDLTDLAPTIAELVGVELSYDTDGASLLSEPPRAGSQRRFHPVEMSGFGNVLVDPILLDPGAGLRASFEDPVGRFLPDRRDADLRPYRLGSFGGLVGTPVAELADREAGEGVVVLHRGARIVAPAADSSVPALLEGRAVEGEVPAVVVVELNGMIAAVAPSFSWADEEGWFTAVVPDALIRPDRNELAFHALDLEEIGGGVAVVLRPLGWDGAPR